jgi:hypothetical protein
MLHVSQITVACLQSMEHPSYITMHCIKFNLEELMMLGELVPYAQEIRGSNPKTSCVWCLLWLQCWNNAACYATSHLS